MIGYTLPELRRLPVSLVQRHPSGPVASTKPGCATYPQRGYVVT